MRVLGLLAIASLVGCYAPGFRECAVLCEAGTSACPGGTSCGSDGYCHGAEPMTCAIGPTFAGLAEALPIGESTVQLRWEPATDARTPTEQLVYRVYVGEEMGEALMTAPLLTTVPGASEVQVGPFPAKTTRWFVVRAVNGDVQEDDNTVEKPATTADLTPPTFGGVEALTASGDTLSVSFTPATDNADDPSAIRYRVYLSTTPGAEDFNAPSETTAAGVSGAIVSGLASAPEYYVVVRAIDSSDNEDKNTVERSISFGDTTAPVFAGATTAQGLPNAVKVSWLAATDNASAQGNIVYVVYQASTAGQEVFTAPVATSAPGATSISIGKLTKSTTYYFVVRAQDEAGNRDANVVEVSAMTDATDDTAPPTFAGLTTATSSGPSSVALTWTAATDVVSPGGEIVYLVYVADSAGAENFSTPSRVTAAGATSFTVTGLQAAKSYYFVVRARDQAGNNDTNSVERSAMTDADNTAPSFGGALSAMPVSSTQINLSWTPATDGVTPTDQIVYLGYVAQSFNGQSFAAPAVTTMPGVTSMQMTGLSPSTAYFFVVRARDGAGNVDTNTNNVMATTLADLVAPTFSGATGATAQSNTSIAITWNAATDDVTPQAQIFYDIFRGNGSGAPATTTPTYTSAAGATGFTATGLNVLSTYSFIVRARDGAGNRDMNTVKVTASTPLF